MHLKRVIMPGVTVSWLSTCDGLTGWKQTLSLFNFRDIVINLRLSGRSYHAGDSRTFQEKWHVCVTLREAPSCSNAACKSHCLIGQRDKTAAYKLSHSAFVFFVCSLSPLVCILVCRLSFVTALCQLWLGFFFLFLSRAFSCSVLFS